MAIFQIGRKKNELRFSELFIPTFFRPQKKKNHSKSNDLKWFSWQREKDSNYRIHFHSGVIQSKEPLKMGLFSYIDQISPKPHNVIGGKIGGKNRPLLAGLFLAFL